MKRKKVLTVVKLAAVSSSMLVLGMTLRGMVLKEDAATRAEANIIQTANDVVAIEQPYGYKIPDWCKEDGGYFPEYIQAYTQHICEEEGVSYPLVLAVIERESEYRPEETGDGGESKGYMQIYQRWHEDRMKKLECTDLLDPFQNIRVGVDYLAELTEKYKYENKVLMYYNRGGRNAYGTGAEELWEDGVYETEYSRAVLQRKSEIEKELGVTE